MTVEEAFSVAKPEEYKAFGFVAGVAKELRQYVQTGWGNGYVALPVGNKYFASHYDEIDVECPGGLTFSEMIEGYWVVGFDTAHAFMTEEDYPEEVVVEETKKLFNQLTA